MVIQEHRDRRQKEKRGIICEHHNPERAHSQNDQGNGVIKTGVVVAFIRQQT
jgi:hypothetical protein